MVIWHSSWGGFWSFAVRQDCRSGRSIAPNQLSKQIYLFKCLTRLRCNVLITVSSRDPKYSSPSILNFSGQIVGHSYMTWGLAWRSIWPARPQIHLKTRDRPMKILITLFLLFSGPNSVTSNRDKSNNTIYPSKSFWIKINEISETKGTVMYDVPSNKQADKLNVILLLQYHCSQWFSTI